MRIESVRGDQLEAGDRLADGHVVDAAFPEGSTTWVDFSWDGTVVDSGYVDSKTRFKVEVHDEL